MTLTWACWNYKHASYPKVRYQHETSWSYKHVKDNLQEIKKEKEYKMGIFKMVQVDQVMKLSRKEELYMS